MQSALQFLIGLTPRGRPPMLVPQDLHTDQESAWTSPHNFVITDIKASLSQPASDPGLAFTVEALDDHYWLSTRRHRLFYNILTFLARRWPSLSPWKPVLPQPISMPAECTVHSHHFIQPILLPAGAIFRTRITQVGRDQPGAGLALSYITEVD